MGSAAVNWTLEGNNAWLNCGPLRGCVRLHQLVAGICDKTWHDLLCDKFAVLQLVVPLVEIAPPRELVDSYIRHSDLVASYARTPPLTVAPQIYWRASFDERSSAVSIEVMLSMHTDLLDSQPHSAVNSIGIGCNLFHTADLKTASFQRLTAAQGANRFDARDFGTHLFLLRSNELRLSYAEMVHPGDFVSTEIDYRGDDLSTYRIHSTLFPDHLEKGVIRRGRICGWFMPVENDMEAAVALARQFVAEPLPLTT
jgi:hypothetical protein